MRLLFSFCPLRFCSLLSRCARRDTDRVTLARLGTAVPRRILTALAIPSLGKMPRSLQVPPGAPTLRASAQACRKKRQVREVFPLSLFCAEPLPRPALRCPVGHRNRDGSLRSPIPSSQGSSLQIPPGAPDYNDRISRVATFWSGADKQKATERFPLLWL